MQDVAIAGRLLATLLVLPSLTAGCLSGSALEYQSQEGELDVSTVVAGEQPGPRTQVAQPVSGEEPTERSESPGLLWSLRGYNECDVGPDIDGDGLPDLFIASGDSFVLANGDGVVAVQGKSGRVLWESRNPSWRLKGGFTAATNLKTWTDLDADGYDDLLVAFDSARSPHEVQGLVTCLSGLSGTPIAEWRGEGAWARFGSALATASTWSRACRAAVVVQRGIEVAKASDTGAIFLLAPKPDARMAARLRLDPRRADYLGDVLLVPGPSSACDLLAVQENEVLRLSTEDGSERYRVPVKRRSHSGPVSLALLPDLSADGLQDWAIVLPVVVGLTEEQTESVLRLLDARDGQALREVTIHRDQGSLRGEYLSWEDVTGDGIPETVCGSYGEVSGARWPTHVVAIDLMRGVIVGGLAVSRPTGLVGGVEAVVDVDGDGVLDIATKLFATDPDNPDYPAQQLGLAVVCGAELRRVCTP
ncbi:MAG TPA: VCBS repeat-containing protein [Planctomycetota bacterium]|nr:VCBS repeat-containing protein [Planctomycetota bacterium]